MITQRAKQKMSIFNEYWNNTIQSSLTLRKYFSFKLLLISSLLAISNGISSQDIVQLHPVVGDTISNSEKVAFYLFPEIKDSCFVEGVIFYQDSTFKVSITEMQKPEYMLAIDSTLLGKYAQNIEKLIHYYSSLEVSDSVDQKLLLSTNSLSNRKAPEYRLNEEERKQLVKESRRYLRKKDKAEDMGIWGVDQELYIKGASNSNILKGKIRF